MWGFIDKNGHEVLPPIYEKSSDFSHDIAFVRLDPQEDGFYIDKNGKQSFETNFGFGKPFSEGYATVMQFQDNKYFKFINKFGESIRINDTHFQNRDSLSNFSDGFAIVVNQESYYFIDKKGEFPFPPFGLSWASDFYNGLSLVCQDDLSYFIDKSGRKYIEDGTVSKLSDFE